MADQASITTPSQAAGELNTTPLSQQVQDEIRRNGGDAALELARTAKDPDVVKTVTCYMCKELFYTENDEGHWEKPVLLPCHHYVGDSCMAIWIEQTKGKTQCPECLFPLSFKNTDCKHCIAPRDIEDAPPKILDENLRPDKCLNCQLSEVSFKGNKEVLEKRVREFAAKAWVKAAKTSC